jgi:DNA-directed RNA polymerase specialized sigma24 family protein
MTAGAVQFKVHRPALIAHSYRTSGSDFDADDAVQKKSIRI